MITAIQAMNICAMTYKNRQPAAIFDYDRSKYIVAAPLKNVQKDFNGGFFSVNKSDGKIEPFGPGEDYDKFFDAIDNKQIKV